MREFEFRYGTRNVLLLALGALLIGAAVGYMAGRSIPPGGPVPHIGIALGPTENAISVEADGWTYNVPLDIAWTDSSGTGHSGGRPDCLPPNGQNIEIKFFSLDAQVDGQEWRPVVSVDCRHAVVLP